MGSAALSSTAGAVLNNSDWRESEPAATAISFEWTLASAGAGIERREDFFLTGASVVFFPAMSLGSERAQRPADLPHTHV